MAQDSSFVALLIACGVVVVAANLTNPLTNLLNPLTNAPPPLTVVPNDNFKAILSAKDPNCARVAVNKAATNGAVQIDFLGKTNDSFGGTINVALDAFCTLNKSDGILFEFSQYFGCLICNTDCIYGHNKYGGSCGVNPLYPTQQTCICADTPAQAAAKNYTTDSATYCGNLFGEWFTNETNVLLFEIIRARYDAVLCVPPPIPYIPIPGAPNNTNCSTSNSIDISCSDECRINHGYQNGGQCLNQLPNWDAGYYKNDPKFKLTAPYEPFCVCNNYTATPNDTSSSPTTTTTPLPDDTTDSTPATPPAYGGFYSILGYHY